MELSPDGSLLWRCDVRKHADDNSTCTTSPLRIALAAVIGLIVLPCFAVLMVLAGRKAIQDHNVFFWVYMMIAACFMGGHVPSIIYYIFLFPRKVVFREDAVDLIRHGKRFRSIPWKEITHVKVNRDALAPKDRYILFSKEFIDPDPFALILLKKWWYRFLPRDCWDENILFFVSYTKEKENIVLHAIQKAKAAGQIGDEDIRMIYQQEMTWSLRI